MTKKQSKQTIGDIYKTIVASNGFDFDNCYIKQFRFETKFEQYGFHYRLMKSGVEVILYDGNDSCATVIVDNIFKSKLDNIA